MKIVNIHLKKILSLSIFTLTLLSLIIFAKLDYTSITQTIDVFLSISFPSLFPFILFIQICLCTNVFDNISKIFGFIATIFGTSKNSSLIIILSYLAGFPNSATMINKMYEENEITKKDVDILTTFTNNCSPLFILVTIGIILLNNFMLGIILLVSHYVSSAIIGIIYSKLYTYIIHEKKSNLKSYVKKVAIYKEKSLTLFEILNKSLNTSFKIMLHMLGFMLIFNMISDIICYILENMGIINTYVFALVKGIFELVEGINILTTNLNLDYDNLLATCIIISILLGFSSISVIFQIKNELKNTTVSLKKIIIFKLLHGILSGIITYILLLNFNVLNKETINVFSNIEANKVDIGNMYTTYLNLWGISLFILSTIVLIKYNIKTKYSIKKLYKY